MCGDLNTYPSQTVLKLFTKCLDLQDAFFHGECDPESCLECKSCHTCDLKGNVFVKPTANPKRIDYLFYSPVASCGSVVVNKEYNHVMKDKIPNRQYNYSDHVGLQVKLVIEKQSPTTAEVPAEISFIDSGIVSSTIDSCRGHILLSTNTAKFYLRRLNSCAYNYVASYLILDLFCSNFGAIIR